MKPRSLLSVAGCGHDVGPESLILCLATPRYMHSTEPSAVSSGESVGSAPSPSTKHLRAIDGWRGLKLGSSGKVTHGSGGNVVQEAAHENAVLLFSTRYMQKFSNYLAFAERELDPKIEGFDKPFWSEWPRDAMLQRVAAEVELKALDKALSKKLAARRHAAGAHEGRKSRARVGADDPGPAQVVPAEQPAPSAPASPPSPVPDADAARSVQTL